MTRCQVCVLLGVLALVNFENGEDLSQENDKKFNVVLFLAQTTTSETYNQDSGIKYLNFVEKTRVKHCASGSGTEDNSVSSYASTGSDCKELLKSGIYALISYCRNVVGMNTAIASMENDTFSNGLRFKKSSSEDLEIRYHHPRSLKNRNQIKSRYITQPEHTEVFKIRSKRQSPVAELPNLGVPEEGKKWDVFGIVANVKLTFFGKFFDKDKNTNQGVPEVPQNHNEVINQLGKVAENCLFDLVKETLMNVQESGDGGFLMIIVGGYLNEICDIYSTLMQSVKHVVENTDERNTLIVLTGACPLVDGPTANGEGWIPVYVRAPPKASSITISGQLYDVPYAIKNLLTEMNGGAYFSGVKSKRGKRDVPETREKRSRANRSPISLPVAFLCIVALLSSY